jgi:hypothetical protein
VRNEASHHVMLLFVRWDCLSSRLIALLIVYALSTHHHHPPHCPPSWNPPHPIPQHTILTYMMLRTPLVELPVDHFHPPNSKSKITTFSPCKHSAKRTLSPTIPSLYSPIKRRILDQEGIFSPEKSLKMPVSLRAQRLPDALRGSGTPGKKLDFGIPKPDFEYVFLLFLPRIWVINVRS